MILLPLPLQALALAAPGPFEAGPLTKIKSHSDFFFFKIFYLEIKMLRLADFLETAFDRCFLEVRDVVPKGEEILNQGSELLEN